MLSVVSVHSHTEPNFVYRLNDGWGQKMSCFHLELSIAHLSTITNLELCFSSFEIFHVVYKKPGNVTPFQSNLFSSPIHDHKIGWKCKTATYLLSNVSVIFSSLSITWKIPSSSSLRVPCTSDWSGGADSSLGNSRYLQLYFFLHEIKPYTVGTLVNRFSLWSDRF